MDAGKLVTDEIIIGVVQERLSQADCMQKGWLLDGFPRTRAQADALAASGVQADIFVFLDVPDEILVERVVGRRTDPETGKIYHMTFSPPENDEVAARLTQRDDDTEEKVKVRLEGFHSNIAAIIDCYHTVGVKINGNGDKNLIFGLAKDFIDAAAAFGAGEFKDAQSKFALACDDAAALATKEALAAALIGQARCQLALGHLKKCSTLCKDVLEVRVCENEYTGHRCSPPPIVPHV